MEYDIEFTWGDGIWHKANDEPIEALSIEEVKDYMDDEFEKGLTHQLGVEDGLTVAKPVENAQYRIINIDNEDDVEYFEGDGKLYYL